MVLILHVQLLIKQMSVYWWKDTPTWYRYTRQVLKM